MFSGVASLTIYHTLISLANWISEISENSPMLNLIVCRSFGYNWADTCLQNDVMCFYKIYTNYLDGAEWENGSFMALIPSLNFWLLQHVIYGCNMAWGLFLICIPISLKVTGLRTEGRQSTSKSSTIGFIL